MTSIQTKIQKVSKLITGQRSNINDIKQYKIKLESISQEILEILSDQKDCPLCGSKFENHYSLLVAIKNSCSSLSVNEEQLKKYEKHKLKLENYNRELNKRIRNNEEVMENISVVMEVAKSINNSGHYNIDMQSPIQDIYSNINRILEDYLPICKEMSDINKSIDSIISEGFSDEQIFKAEIFAAQNELFNRYKEDQNKNSLSFYNYVLGIKGKYESKKKNVEKEINSNNYVVQTNNDFLKLINIEDINKKIDECYRKEEIVNNVKQQMKILLNYFNISNDDDLKTWVSSFSQAVLKLNISIKELELIEDLKSKSENLKILKRDEIDFQKYFENCNKAVIAFRKMRLLKDYSLDFINNNIKRIKYFFKFIHSPREFSQLR